MTTIFTIGYGNRNLHTFIDLLKENQIKTLVDVRSYPYSRFNPNYNKKSLQLLLKDINIEYLYMGDTLGGKPKDKNLYINDKLHYQTVNSAPIYKVAISELIKLSENINTCIMCCELNPDHCHRKNLIAETLIEQNISVTHINEKGLLFPHIKSSILGLF